MLDKDDSADQAALAAGLAKICGLTPAELLDQLEPQITAKIRRNQRGSKIPSALAASDSTQRKGRAPAVNKPGRQAPTLAPARRPPGQGRSSQGRLSGPETIKQARG
jgi:hypothetical protein